MFMYVLLSDDNQRLKIGVSSWYEARHKVLKDSTPFTFSCVMVFKFNTRGKAEAIEKAIKQRLSGYRSFDSVTFDGGSEWFNLTPFVKRFISEVYTKLRLTNLHKVDTKSLFFKS